MAQREPRRWVQAALGGLMVALGGALFGAGRGGRAMAKPAVGKDPKANKSSAGGAVPKGKGAGQSGAKPVAKPSRSGRAAAQRPKVRTKPRTAAPPARTHYWPPPPPKPIGSAEQGAGQGAEPVDAQSVKLGYERFDAKPGTIVTVMLASAAAIAVSITALFFLIGLVHRGDRQAPPLTRQQLAVIVPPGPHLQDHPLHDIAMERKRETDLLSAYAWADPRHRTARIPIARAEALVIGRPLDPLPSAGPAAPEPAGDDAVPAPASPSAQP